MLTPLIIKRWRCARLSMAGSLIILAACGYSTRLLALSLGSLSLSNVSRKPIATTATAIPANQQIASLWSLSTQEWQRYQQLMQGPAGRWYPQLDPPEVLGILARTAAEQHHYATLVVQQRKARLDRELAFNRAVHEAWVSEYSNLKPIKSFDARPFRVIKNKAH